MLLHVAVLDVEHHASSRGDVMHNLEHDAHQSGAVSRCPALVEMDQADLARKAVVSRNVIVDFERGSRTPLANNLAAIKRVLFFFME
jgi:predicted transcriptional regulator